MVLFNSIFKKQNVKTFMLVYTVSILAIYYLITIKNFYITSYNNTYEDSFLEIKYITTNDTINKLSKIKNITKMKKGIMTNYKNRKYFVTENKELEKMEVVLSNDYQRIYHYNSSFYLHDNKYLVRTFSNDLHIDEIQVSSNIYEKLSRDKPITLRIKLKDWSLELSTKTYIEKQLSLKVENYKKVDLKSYKYTIRFYTIFIDYLIIIFLIYLTISIFIVIKREKTIIYFLHNIGFSKNNIIAIYSIKIFCLLLISNSVSFMFIVFFNTFQS